MFVSPKAHISPLTERRIAALLATAAHTQSQRIAAAASGQTT
jgi:hypothetical protein